MSTVVVLPALTHVALVRLTPARRRDLADQISLAAVEEDAADQAIETARASKKQAHERSMSLAGQLGAGTEPAHVACTKHVDLKTKTVRIYRADPQEAWDDESKKKGGLVKERPAEKADLDQAKQPALPFDAAAVASGQTESGEGKQGKATPADPVIATVDIDPAAVRGGDEISVPGEKPSSSFAAPVDSLDRPFCCNNPGCDYHLEPTRNGGKCTGCDEATVPIASVSKPSSSFDAPDRCCHRITCPEAWKPTSAAWCSGCGLPNMTLAMARQLADAQDGPTGPSDDAAVTATTGANGPAREALSPFGAIDRTRDRVAEADAIRDALADGLRSRMKAAAAERMAREACTGVGPDAELIRLAIDGLSDEQADMLVELLELDPQEQPAPAPTRKGGEGKQGKRRTVDERAHDAAMDAVERTAMKAMGGKASKPAKKGGRK